MERSNTWDLKCVASKNLKGNFPSCLVSKMTDFKGVTACDRPIPISKSISKLKMFDLKGDRPKPIPKPKISDLKGATTSDLPIPISKPKLSDFKFVTINDKPKPIPIPKLFHLNVVTTTTVFKKVVQEEKDASRAFFLWQWNESREACGFNQILIRN